MQQITNSPSFNFDAAQFKRYSTEHQLAYPPHKIHSAIQRLLQDQYKPANKIANLKKLMSQSSAQQAAVQLVHFAQCLKLNLLHYETVLKKNMYAKDDQLKEVAIAALVKEITQLMYLICIWLNLNALDVSGENIEQILGLLNFSRRYLQQKSGFLIENEYFTQDNLQQSLAENLIEASQLRTEYLIEFDLLQVPYTPVLQELHAEKIALSSNSFKICQEELLASNTILHGKTLKTSQNYSNNRYLILFYQFKLHIFRDTVQFIQTGVKINSKSFAENLALLRQLIASFQATDYYNTASGYADSANIDHLYYRIRNTMKGIISYIFTMVALADDDIDNENLAKFHDHLLEYALLYQKRIKTLILPKLKNSSNTLFAKDVAKQDINSYQALLKFIKYIIEYSKSLAADKQPPIPEITTVDNNSSLSNSIPPASEEKSVSSTNPMVITAKSSNFTVAENFPANNSAAQPLSKDLGSQLNSTVTIPPIAKQPATHSITNTNLGSAKKANIIRQLAAAFRQKELANKSQCIEGINYIQASQSIFKKTVYVGYHPDLIKSSYLKLAQDKFISQFEAPHFASNKNGQQGILTIAKTDPLLKNHEIKSEGCTHKHKCLGGADGKMRFLGKVVQETETCLYFLFYIIADHYKIIYKAQSHDKNDLLAHSDEPNSNPYYNPG